MKKLFRLLVVTAGAIAAYMTLLRPRIIRWGATDDEITRPLPGDDIVPAPKSHSTRAITIDAPVDEVWPWLVQIGYQRAGWYSYDFIEALLGATDFVDGHSSRRIVPELQNLAEGDSVNIAAQMPFTVKVLEANRALVLLANVDINTGESYDLDGPPPEQFYLATWTFALEPADDQTTRLIVRWRSDFTPGMGLELGMGVLLEPGHFMMEEKMLRGLKHRAEALHRAQDSWRIDELLPLAGCEVHLKHTVTVNRPRAEVWQALKDVRFSDMPVVRGLMAIRSLGATEESPGDEEEGPLFGFLEDANITRLVETPDRELVQLLMGHFWKLDGGFKPIPDTEAFVNASAPTWVKCAVAYQLEDAPGGTALTSDLRVQFPADPMTARLFWAYWWLMGVFGALTSARGIQSAAKRRAEASYSAITSAT